MTYVTHQCFGGNCLVCHPAVYKSNTVPYKCPVCEGRGVVDCNFYDRLGSGITTGNVLCRSCINGIIFA